jgi:hypothetical protein
LVVVVVGHDDVAVILGQLGQRVAQDGFAFASCPRLVRVVGRRTERRKTAEVVEVETLDQAGAVAALRAHQHERLVGRHAEEPGREVRIAAKGGQTAHHLEQCHLQEVPPVFVRDRVPQELSLDMRAYPQDELLERVLLSGLRPGDQGRFGGHDRF